MMTFPLLRAFASKVARPGPSVAFQAVRFTLAATTPERARYLFQQITQLQAIHSSDVPLCRAAIGCTKGHVTVCRKVYAVAGRTCGQPCIQHVLVFRKTPVRMVDHFLEDASGRLQRLKLIVRNVLDVEVYCIIVDLTRRTTYLTFYRRNL